MAQLQILKLVLFCYLLAAAACFAQSPVQKVPGGRYQAFLKQTNGSINVVELDAFSMDRYPVTQKQYLDFVTKNPEWKKGSVKSIFAESHYLQNWKSDLNFGANRPNSPVTFVSWFAATAYCKSVGKDLPTTDQWEYVAEDRGSAKADLTRKILDWYSEPSHKNLNDVGLSKANGFGVHDQFGLIWEWTQDFSGTEGGDDAKFVCGGGSQMAADAADYASFMRYSFRNSLQAKYAVGNLGFRCAGVNR